MVRRTITRQTNSISAAKAQRPAARAVDRKGSGRLELVLDSDLGEVEQAEGLLNEFAVQCGCDEQECSDIELAVRETVINAMQHGNRLLRNKKVYVTAEVRSQRDQRGIPARDSLSRDKANGRQGGPGGKVLCITVRDEGEGFNPRKVVDPTKPENLLRESGRGILMMHTLMDRVTIRPAPEKGTQVRMVKKISRKQQPQSEEEQRMSLNVTTRQTGGVTILDFDGRIILGEPTEAIRDHLQNLVSKGQKKILLNLGGVSYIDSSGLGALVRGYSTLASQQGQLKLLNLTKKVHDLLQITKLYTVFEIFNDEAAALKSFQ